VDKPVDNSIKTSHPIHYEPNNKSPKPHTLWITAIIKPWNLS